MIGAGCVLSDAWKGWSSVFLSHSDFSITLVSSSLTSTYQISGRHSGSEDCNHRTLEVRKMTLYLWVLTPGWARGMSIYEPALGGAGLLTAGERQGGGRDEFQRAATHFWVCLDILLIPPAQWHPMTRAISTRKGKSRSGTLGSMGSVCSKKRPCGE